MNIEDERAIVAVLVRYATAIDRRDWDLFGTCFTHDVEADYGDIGSWRGRTALVEYMARGHAPIGPTLHRLTNFVITGDNRCAHATSYVDALLLRPQPGVALRRAYGLYEDRLIHEADGWRICRRTFTMALLQEDPQPPTY